MEIILASYNEGKAREIAAILDPVKVRCLKEFGVKIDFDSVEDGETYEENARKKVDAVAQRLAAAQRLEAIIVADDSGLEVDALDGRPGVQSARYGGPDMDDSKRYVKLLEELGGAPEGKRGARFVCVLAVRRPDGDEIIIRGECPGVIAAEPRGEGGFGYDPVFLLPDRGLTMAQITPEEKNSISHRANAFRALKKELLQT